MPDALAERSLGTSARITLVSCAVSLEPDAEAVHEERRREAPGRDVGPHQEGVHRQPDRLQPSARPRGGRSACRVSPPPPATSAPSAGHREHGAGLDAESPSTLCREQGDGEHQVIFPEAVALISAATFPGGEAADAGNRPR